MDASQYKDYVLLMLFVKYVSDKYAGLEYIVVHELLHLLEPTHNHRFVALMDQFMPKWQHFRDMLNKLPVRHEEWEY